MASGQLLLCSQAFDNSIDLCSNTRTATIVHSIVSFPAACSSPARIACSIRTGRAFPRADTASDRCWGNEGLACETIHSICVSKLRRFVPQPSASYSSSLFEYNHFVVLSLLACRVTSIIIFFLLFVFSWWFTISSVAILLSLYHHNQLNKYTPS